MFIIQSSSRSVEMERNQWMNELLKTIISPVEYRIVIISVSDPIESKNYIIKAETHFIFILTVGIEPTYFEEQKQKSVYYST